MQHRPPFRFCGGTVSVNHMCWTVDASDPIATRNVRKAAAAALGPHGPGDDTMSDAELIIGELLGNAARHAGGHVCLEIGDDDEHIQVSVHDLAPDFHLDIRRPIDELSESGRGLMIISRLARHISIVPLAGMGKRVAVTLDLPSRPGGEASCSRAWLRHEAGVCMRPRIAKYHPETIRTELGQAPL